MASHDREIVASLRASLVDRVGPDKYEVWFGENVAFQVSETALTVFAPNKFTQDWLRNHFRRDLEAAAALVSTRPLAIEFRVDVAVARSRSGRASASRAKPTTPQQSAAALDGAHAASTVAGRLAPNDPAPHGRAPDDPATHVAARDGMSPRRLAADRSCSDRVSSPRAVGVVQPRRLPLRLEDFSVAPSNRVAWTAARMAATEPGAMSPLVIGGPNGCGKTHLLEGIVRRYRASFRATAIYLTAEQFASQFMEALQGRGMPSFRRKYRDVGLLAIDDLPFLANKTATIRELMHTIDTITRGGGQVVCTLDRPLAEVRGLPAELIVRLSAGMTCHIELAEPEVRLAIVRRAAAEIPVELPVDLAEYLAERITGDARLMIGAVKRLHATSLAFEKPLSVAMAADVLSELAPPSGVTFRLPDIQEAVCQALGVPTESLQSPEKRRSTSNPRMLAMWLARKYTRAALSEIGAFFGGRSHSTVIAAQRQVEAWLGSGGAVQIADRTLPVGEALRRVEQRLRAVG